MSSNTTSMASPTAAADPFNQNFTLLLPDGSPFYVGISDLDAWYIYSVYVSIEYASQLGASIALLVVLILLTKPDKRLSPIFLINASALLLNFLRLLLACLYFTGPFSEAYAYLVGDFTRINPSAYGVSVAAEVLVVITTMLVELSLLLQTHVVCLTLRRIYRTTLLVISSLVASTCIGWRVYLGVVNIQLTLSTISPLTILPKIESISNFVTTASIFWFSAIFVSKLGHAIHRRRKLGLRKWGSMQIIFAMGCQTLVIPGRYLLYHFHGLKSVGSNTLEALFSALQYLIDFPAIASFVLTLVALFLPLSSLWASASVEGNSASPKEPSFVQMRKGGFGAGKKDSLSEGSSSWYSPTTDRFSGKGGGFAV